jgi:hypothetical protein
VASHEAGQTPASSTFWMLYLQEQCPLSLDRLMITEQPPNPSPITDQQRHNTNSIQRCSPDNNTTSGHQHTNSNTPTLARTAVSTPLEWVRSKPLAVAELYVWYAAAWSGGCAGPCCNLQTNKDHCDDCVVEATAMHTNFEQHSCTGCQGWLPL